LKISTVRVGHLAEPGVVAAGLQEIRRPGLVEVQVAGEAAVVGGGGQIAPGLAQGVGGEVETREREDPRVRAGDADGDEIGVVLHLTRKGGMGEVDAAEEEIESLAHRPEPGGEDPGEDGDADVGALGGGEHVVEPVAAVDHIGDDAVGGIDVAAELHAVLREVAELVSQHRLELGEIETIDQPQADDQVLLRREEEVQHRFIERNRGVHVGGEEDAVREGRAGLLAQFADEGEQVGLFGFSDFDAHAGIDARALEESLDEEEAEQPGEDAADDEAEDRLVGRCSVAAGRLGASSAARSARLLGGGRVSGLRLLLRQPGDAVVAGVGRADRQAEVDDDEDEEAGEDDDDAGAVAPRRPGQVRGDVGRGGRIEARDIGGHRDPLRRKRENHQFTRNAGALSVA
jgi:hypothetical protein